jgi:hypothetical protein
MKNWRGRETAEPPSWLGNLMSAGWKQALKTGLAVILLMPSDILVMLTVGVNLEHQADSVMDATPFYRTHSPCRSTPGAGLHPVSAARAARMP